MTMQLKQMFIEVHPERKPRTCMKCGKQYTTYNPERCHACWARWNDDALMHPRGGHDRIDRGDDIQDSTLKRLFAEVNKPITKRRPWGTYKNKIGKWCAQFKRFGRSVHLGTREARTEAMKLYENYTKRLYKERFNEDGTPRKETEESFQDR